MRLVLRVLLLVTLSSGAFASPPPNCLPVTLGAKLRPVASVGELNAWVQVASGSSAACVKIAGCAWRLDQADLLMGAISTYASANPDGVCDLLSDGSEACKDPSQLEEQFGALAELLTKSLANTNLYCRPGQDIVRTTGNAVIGTGADTVSLLTLPIGGHCLNLIGRRNSAAVLVSTSCLSSTDLSALNTDLSSEFFALNDAWIAGTSGSFRLGLPMDLSGAGASLQNAPQTSGFTNSTYVTSWLSKVYTAAQTVGPGNDLDRSSDPLPIPSNTEIGGVLHWIAAAVARLEPIPFDASTGWSEQQTKNAAARDWMATVELDDPASYGGTHFRAELARN